MINKEEIIPYPFSTIEEYELIINSKAYKKFYNFCIGIENIDILRFFYNFFNPFFSEPLEYLNRQTFNRLFQNLEFYDYHLEREKNIFNKIKDIGSNDKNKESTNKKKNLENYIKYCKNHTFKEEYGKAITYFITNGEFVKIGQSKKPKERLLAIQPYNPKELTLLAIFDNLSESEAHFFFSNKHVRREWYKFDIEVIIKIELLKKELTRRFNKMERGHKKKIFKRINKNVKIKNKNFKRK